MQRYRDVVTGGLSVLLGLGLYLASLSIVNFGAAVIGSSFMPRLCAAAFVVFGAILVVSGLRARAVTARPLDEAQHALRLDRKISGAAAVAVSLVLMAGYVAALQPLGYILASALYIVLQILVLSSRGPVAWLRLLVIAGLSSALAYLLFVHVFQVTIPAGILG